MFPQADGKGPMWDSWVRKALKQAAAEEGCDFPGLGPHTLRRANITWRQEVGGSSIEASQIAGHANSKMTEEYTVVQLRRQEELTRRLQEKLAQAVEPNTKREKITRVIAIKTPKITRDNARGEGKRAGSGGSCGSEAALESSP